MSEQQIVDPHVREWLKVPVKHDERPPVKWTSQSPSDGKMTITGLTAKEFQAVQQFLQGTSWIRCVDGRLAACEAHNTLPEPEDDPLLSEHWKAGATLKTFGEVPEVWDARIMIHAVGAGARLKRDAQNSIKIAWQMGFECMRSKRGDDGKFWEVWILHGTWQAKGILKDFKDSLEKTLSVRQRVDAMAEFIAQRSGLRFGSMDVLVQTWALSFD